MTQSPSGSGAREPDGIVIVGAGVAGLSTAEELRDRGYTGPLVLVGEERHPPYDRPPLSKEYLTGDPAHTRVALRDNSDLAALRLDLRLGRQARALDPAHRLLTLDDGSTVRYHGLVIATGARARRPATNLAGVHTLRGLDDADAIRRAFATHDRVVVVGAGFIGTEVAASARHLGLDVTLVDAADTPMAGPLHPRLGEIVADIHREHGVALRLGAGVAGFEGAERVERVLLSDGSTVDTPLVVAGLGVAPDTEWLAGSGIELVPGAGDVSCDMFCATSAPNVYAVGDVANWPHPHFGRLRLEHWTNAREQAAVVAHNLLASPENQQVYAPVPYVWSDQYGMKFQLLGQAAPADDVEIVHGSPDERKFVAFLGREGRLTGILGLRSTPKVMRYRRLLTESTSWTEALAAAGR
ncbi:FAD-dependent oxidoreductase [Lipingzhangella sp. LS1_29]|uniref:FAD-dependent oxidoreductase n=1 Tax=Lipingzhangella rawalii TaxID=2055835 RepID=A0ABU2HAT2_9ACTN|nr:FAD-dependent oxidoreductase [Lipingzhangella rawalii]MDS1271950.1 FAD-dependent oxidoreductase [Lipingzhangella rawalii]